jgi:hypothetical protein
MRSFGNEFEASAARYVTTDAITTKAGHIQASALACPTDPRQFPSGVIIPSRRGPSFEAGKCSAAFDMNTGWKISPHKFLRTTGWSTTAIGRFYNGRDHSTVCYSIQRIKIVREINRKVDQLLRNLEKALQDPQPSLADSSCLKRPASIRLDKLREEVVLDKLADRIASRLVRLLGGVDVSARPLLTGGDVSGVRSGDFTNVKNH